MHKYKVLHVNDKVKIVKSNDPFTRTITNKLIGEIGVITGTGQNPRAPINYFVHLKAIKAVLHLQRDALEYYGRSIPFNPLHRVLSNGEIIDACIRGLHTESNKSIIHAINRNAWQPMCGSRSGLDFYTAILDLAPKITCQKCLGIMHHRVRSTLESL